MEAAKAFGIAFKVPDDLVERYKTSQLYQQPPYRDHFAFVEPLVEIPVEEAKPFDCAGTRERHPKETKGQDYNATTEAAQCLSGGEGASCC